MKKRILMLLSVFPALSYGQTQVRNDAGLQGDAGAISGFFETLNPSNYPAGATSWWHLLDVRHSNNANNYAMQFAGSFYDQNLYFRKTNNNAAQVWSKVLLETSGKVGIGTINPVATLDVKGDIAISNAAIPMGITTEVLGTTPLLNFSINFRNPGIINQYIGAAFRVDTRVESSLFQWLKRDPGSSTESLAMSLSRAGNLGIGIENPTEKLAVNGNIRAKEIKVETTNWPDYVFDQDYQLIGLNELDTYIKANKHLPDMPSATVTEKDGVELGEMNKLLLKKVEELTLYLIEKDKAMNALYQRVEALEHKQKK